MEGDADPHVKGEDPPCSSSTSHPPSVSLKESKSRNFNMGKADPRVFFSSSSSTRHDSARVRARGTRRVPDLSRPAPVDVIFSFHKALIKSMRDVVGTSLELGENPGLFREFVLSFRLLRSFYKVHSDAEDESGFPAMEELAKDQNMGLSFYDDHKFVNELFGSLSEILEEASEGQLMSDYVTRVQNICHSLQTLLSEHVQNEEMVWAICKELLSAEEQERIVGSILGRTRAEILRDMIPWLLKYLTSQEQQCLMSTLQQITRNTNFWEWLKNSGVVPQQSQDPVENIRSSLSRDILNQRDHRDDDTGEGKGTETAESLVPSRDELETEIRRASSDSPVDVQEKLTATQNLLTSRYDGARQKSGSELENRSSDGEDISGRSPSYRNIAAKAFGCKHYKSNCKLFMPCCSQLYPCRRCHDEMSDHLIDRVLITKMMCMTCLEVQPVGPSCSTTSCDTSSMAKYYCLICKIFDDEREIYHCPFCNLCRVGKGLGVDYFHCMNCNACMSRSLSVHICREKCFEDNCPICHEYIFTSHMPVKALRCGHLMHSSCFKEFTCTHYACPICSKSLGDMQAYFEMLDELLAEEKIPDEYRGITQEILCNDCEKRGNSTFHWLYHKCPYCGSYNTRLL
ncbi:hypothetical protein MLD38_031951 [Melastoma candidum]|uniref:Uncharacterized protein n=1 Tax=Melastoma candidum TaxID=119954 RepID=A0ACB9MR56_9MYRT|nr:hypothetical protein MLD38_031951 [Melastoma candidum]